MRRSFLPKEAAELLSVSVDTIRRAIKSGHLKAARIGSTYRISQRDLNNYYWSQGGGQLFADAGTIVSEEDMGHLVTFGMDLHDQPVRCPVCRLDCNHILKIRVLVPGIDTVEITREGIQRNPDSGESPEGAVVEMMMCCEGRHKYLTRFAFRRGRVYAQWQNLGSIPEEECAVELPRR